MGDRGRMEVITDITGDTSPLTPLSSMLLIDFYCAATVMLSSALLRGTHPKVLSVCVYKQKTSIHALLFRLHGCIWDLELREDHILKVVTDQQIVAVTNIF